MPTLLATSRELVQRQLGKGVWQFGKRVIRGLKRALNMAIGCGPYRLRPFNELCDARNDPRNYIYTANPDSTGILRQETTESVCYNVRP